MPMPKEVTLPPRKNPKPNHNITERQARALALRATGHSIIAVAEDLGITRQGAWLLIKRARRNIL